MLLELSIERIALIDSLRLKFDEGFNVFTGETGAGKSIVLDAIGLLLGNRATSDLIRQGSDNAVVEAVLSCPPKLSDTLALKFTEWGIPFDGESIVLARELQRTGRSICRINGRLGTVQMLKDIGGRMVQQHGQHDHQGLLEAEEQMRALDLFGRHESLQRDVEQAYRRYADAKLAVEQSHLDEQSRARRIDMLRFQMEEIEAASLKPGEEESLRDQRNRLVHAEKIGSALQQASWALGGTESRPGAISQLDTALEQVTAVAQYAPDLEEALQLLQTARVHAEEAARVVYKLSDPLREDPEQLNDIEARLVQIKSVSRKYGATVDDVLEFYESTGKELDKLVRHEETISQLESEFRAAESALLALCQELHLRRESAANRLSVEVESVLRKLNMPSARLHIHVQARRDVGGLVFGPNGADTVQFLFSANKGEEVKPMHKIASGGELSRTLLALKSVLAELDDLDTLIFDEIDTGVSGSAAQSIADQLTRISQTRQVLCVTHSPQLSAAGDAHFFIRKHEQGDSTTTTVVPLTEHGRVQELARLLGAVVSDETAVHHAKALLERSHKPA